MHNEVTLFKINTKIAYYTSLKFCFSHKLFISIRLSLYMTAPLLCSSAVSKDFCVSWMRLLAWILYKLITFSVMFKPKLDAELQ